MTSTEPAAAPADPQPLAEVTAAAATMAAAQAERVVAPMVVGLLFWLIVIGAGVFFYVHEEEADVFLEVSGTPQTLQGRVVYGGVPADGVLQVRVADARSKQLVSSATVEVKAGLLPPTSLGLTAPPAGTTKPGLRIDAEFRGTAKPAKDKEAVSVRGASTEFLNVSPPLARHAVYWSVGAVAAFGAILTFLITGSMGPTKAHLLFAFMYLATFLALAMPIVLSAWVAQNPFLREKLEEAPVGLVLAQAEGATRPQWLINIGGKVLPGGEPKAGEARPQPGAGTAPGKEGTPQAPDQEKTAPPAPTGDAPLADSGPRVVGGLTVPFFVVMLAMFGAGVNLTRKVPEIQRNYYQFLGKAQPSLLAATGVALAGLFRSRGVPEDAGGAEIRKSLVQNIMYFAAAPFLGIAVYYLLRVLATEVTLPVLVIAAFATGLVSDTIVEKVIEIAGQTIKPAAGGQGDGAAAPPPPEAERQATPPDTGKPGGNAEAPPKG